MRYIRYIKPAKATGLVDETYKMMTAEFAPIGSLPGGDPACLHSLHPKLLYAWWSVLRETVLVESRVSRVVKESVSSAISLSNDCPYCLDQHTAILTGLGEKAVSEAISSCDLSLIEDEEQRRIVHWAISHFKPGVPLVKKPPFTEDEAPEIIGTATFFNYTNRMVEVFLGKGILPIYIEALRGILKKVAVLVFKDKLHLERKAGITTRELQNKTIGNNIEWTYADQRIASSWTRFIDEVDALGKLYIPLTIRLAVIQVLNAWKGADKSVNYQEALNQKLTGSRYLIAEYLCKVAFEADKVGNDDIGVLKSLDYDDEGILAVTAWASLMVSVRISRWLGRTFVPVSLGLEDSVKSHPNNNVGETLSKKAT